MPEQAPEGNVRQAVPFFAVSDMEASLRFYVDGLGFALSHRIEFESDTDVAEETVFEEDAAAR